LAGKLESSQVTSLSFWNILSTGRNLGEHGISSHQVKKWMSRKAIHLLIHGRIRVGNEIF
jgi:predicted AlkP superfamily phosphohydrolase/phosphomutase